MDSYLYTIPDMHTRAVLVPVPVLVQMLDRATKGADLAPDERAAPI